MPIDLAGHAYTEKGVAIPNCTVTLKDADTNSPLSGTTTDATGFWFFNALADGTVYKVEVETPTADQKRIVDGRDKPPQSIGSGQIAPAGVQAANIADGAVTSLKFRPDQATDALLGDADVIASTSFSNISDGGDELSVHFVTPAATSGKVTVLILLNLPVQNTAGVTGQINAKAVYNAGSGTGGTMQDTNARTIATVSAGGFGNLCCAGLLRGLDPGTEYVIVVRAAVSAGVSAVFQANSTIDIALWGGA